LRLESLCLRRIGAMQMPDSALPRPVPLLSPEDAAALVASYPAVSPLAQVKDIGRLDPHLARFIATAPICFVATASAEGKQDGKLYAVPLAQQTLQMFYNKDLFAKQGLTPPTTWAQFIEVNARLKEQGITPMAVGAKDSWTLPIVHQVLATPRFGGAAFQKAVLSGQKTFTDPDWVASVGELRALKPYLPASAVGVEAIRRILERDAGRASLDALRAAAELSGITEQAFPNSEHDKYQEIRHNVDCSQVNRLAREELARRGSG